MKLKTLSMALFVATQLHATMPRIDETALLSDESPLSMYDVNYSRRFIPYIKLGPEITNLGRHNVVMPGFGFGFRSESNTSAVDCSFSGAFAETKEGATIYHIFAPKLLYLKYLNSYSPSALFVGFGSSWSLIRNEVTKNEFNGLAGILSAGIERNRSSRMRQIIQIDVNQPLLSLKIGNSLPLPTIETSFSLGF